MMVKSVILPLAPPAAFELFTQRISEWWPPDRRHTKDPTSEIFLLRSGRFYERARDGHEVELGCVRSWELPRRILLDFFIATGPDKDHVRRPGGRHARDRHPQAETRKRGPVGGSGATLRAVLGQRAGRIGARGG
jgi:hypothetical protein